MTFLELLYLMSGGTMCAGVIGVGRAEGILGISVVVGILIGLFFFCLQWKFNCKILYHLMPDDAKVSPMKFLLGQSIGILEIAWVVGAWFVGEWTMKIICSLLR
jgi:hypothetical protein